MKHTDIQDSGITAGTKQKMKTSQIPFIFFSILLFARKRISEVPNYLVPAVTFVARARNQLGRGCTVTKKSRAKMQQQPHNLVTGHTYAKLHCSGCESTSPWVTQEYCWLSHCCSRVV